MAITACYSFSPPLNHSGGPAFLVSVGGNPSADLFLLERAFNFILLPMHVHTARVISLKPEEQT